MAKYSVELLYLCTALVFTLWRVEGISLTSVLKKPTTRIQLEYGDFEHLVGLKKGSSRGNTVAFSAQLPGNLKNVKPFETIKYSSVTLNPGNHYNGKTGVFTAPSPGIYYFSWTILASAKQPFNTAIVVNDSKRWKAYNYCNPSPLRQQMCSKSVLVQLSTADQVWIVAYQMSVESAHGGTWPQFSGFKLA
ncbi:complement C1q-like protein 3 [Saccostrea cucullata]|uniref:complement C1q-like protein 3 n=1 Tax=Saccostrea cuccullata TaxID=36930 RepID=UPI002ED20E3E